jgi:UDP:flavonoid glycosyltransferase YjiC (YdhE family)
MPTLVRQQADSKPASANETNGFAVAALLLGIAVAGALFSSIFPLPADLLSVPDIVLAPDQSFFGP